MCVISVLFSLLAITGVPAVAASLFKTTQEVTGDRGVGLRRRRGGRRPRSPLKRGGGGTGRRRNPPPGGGSEDGPELLFQTICQIKTPTAMGAKTTTIAIS